MTIITELNTSRVDGCVISMHVSQYRLVSTFIVCVQTVWECALYFSRTAISTHEVLNENMTQNTNLTYTMSIAL